MPREVLVYVGIGGKVVALDDATGTEVWRAELRGSDYVGVLWDGAVLLASCDGEVWRLDPRTGAEIWHNQLKGLGRGLAGLATLRQSTERGGADADAAQHHVERSRAAAAAAS
jgi:outer membrane protein assembly factor BamB